MAGPYEVVEKTGPQVKGHQIQNLNLLKQREPEVAPRVSLLTNVSPQEPAPVPYEKQLGPQQQQDLWEMKAQFRVFRPARET